MCGPSPGNNRVERVDDSSKFLWESLRVLDFPVLVPRRPGETLAEIKLRVIQRVGEKLVRIFDPKQLMDEMKPIAAAVGREI